MFENSSKLEIGWKQSYRLLKKKAMEQELSWSGLVISLSIAFFIVAGSAGILNALHNSVENKTFSPAERRLEGQRLIEVGGLAALMIKSAEAAAPVFKAEPIKGTEFASLSHGQVATQTIRLKNTGDRSWKPGEVKVETGPYLKTPSKLQASDWKSFYEPIALPREVKPGQTVDISFSVKAPTGIDGMIQENFQLVAANQPIPGSLVRVFVTIGKPASPAPSQPTPAAPAPVPTIPPTPPLITPAPTVPNESADPTMRIGLFNSPIGQRLTFDGPFDVIAGNEMLFSGLSASTTALIVFDPASRRYTVTVGSSARTTISPVRFIPRNSSSVATLLDYRNGPSWNLAASDNRFRGIIEVRFTEPAKKVWYINELGLETYLRGLAETTNASPVEFQKVMVTAARTYALYHYNRGIQYGVPNGSTKHASDHFHIDATYDQVYRGYNSELRMPRLSAAVEATRGVAVTYAGQPVVTPYFSISDGRTRAYEEVWGGSGMPWLKSVIVPQDRGKTLAGHGVGMSAWGGLLMVNEGKSWQDVLKYFYTGIELLKMY